MCIVAVALAVALAVWCCVLIVCFLVVASLGGEAQPSHSLTYNPPPPKTGH